MPFKVPLSSPLSQCNNATSLEINVARVIAPAPVLQHLQESLLERRRLQHVSRFARMASYRSRLGCGEGLECTSMQDGVLSAPALSAARHNIETASETSPLVARGSALPRKDSTTQILTGERWLVHSFVSFVTTTSYEYRIFFTRPVGSPGEDPCHMYIEHLLLAWNTLHRFDAAPVILTVVLHHACSCDDVLQIRHTASIRPTLPPRPQQLQRQAKPLSRP